MKDWLHSILQWVDYNRYKVVAFVLAVALIGWLHGCEPQTSSILRPGESIDYQGLQQEVVTGTTSLNKRVADYNAMGEALQQDIEAFNQKATLAEADLKQQFELREAVIQTSAGLIGSLATGNPINIADTIASAATILLTFFGAGAIADKRRADVKILEMKSGKTPT